jgi:hypothetical protein
VKRGTSNPNHMRYGCKRTSRVLVRAQKGHPDHTRVDNISINLKQAQRRRWQLREGSLQFTPSLSSLLLRHPWSRRPRFSPLMKLAPHSWRKLELTILDALILLAQPQRLCHHPPFGSPNSRSSRIISTSAQFSHHDNSVSKYQLFAVLFD